MRQIILAGFLITGISGLGLSKTYIHSDDGAPTNMDPVQSGTTYSNTVVTAVYDTLYEYKYLKRPFELKPNLAEGLPEISKDGLTYTFKIKKGVRYADDACFPGGKGREVIAADLVYSIKRHFDPKNISQGAWLWAGKVKGLDEWKKAGGDYKKEVSGLKALDKYTIQVVLKKPFPQLMYTFAMGFSAFVPKEAVEKYGKELSIHPVGSGPFKLVSHNTRKSVLVKNPNYRKEVMDLKLHGYDKKLHGPVGLGSLEGKQLPIVDKVEILWTKELVARWNSFTRRDGTMYTWLQNEQVPIVLESKQPVKLKKSFADKYHFRTAPESGLVYNHFNMQNPEFGYNKDKKREERNKALRCAMRSALNWQERIDRFYLGIGQAYPGFIPPMVAGYDPEASRESVTLDIAKAKKLLADNGWNAGNLPTITYPATAGVRQRQFFEQFRGNMMKIGFPRQKIKYNAYASFGDFNKATRDARTDMVPMGWGLDYPDAENTLGLFYGPNKSPGSNSANYTNPEFDKLYEKATAMQDSPERTELYKQLNKMIIDDCVTISAFSRTRVHMWHKQAIMWPARSILGNYLKYVDVTK